MGTKGSKEPRNRDTDREHHRQAPAHDPCVFCSEMAIVTVFKCWRAQNLSTLDFNNGYCRFFCIACFLGLKLWRSLSFSLSLLYPYCELKCELCGIRDDSNNNTYKKKNNNHCSILHYVSDNWRCVEKKWTFRCAGPILRGGGVGVCVFHFAFYSTKRDKDKGEDQCLCLRSIDAFDRLNCQPCLFFHLYSPITFQFFVITKMKNVFSIFIRMFVINRQERKKTRRKHSSFVVS